MGCTLLRTSLDFPTGQTEHFVGHFPLLASRERWLAGARGPGFALVAESTWLIRRDYFLKLYNAKCHLRAVLWTVAILAQPWSDRLVPIASFRSLLVLLKLTTFGVKLIARGRPDTR